MAQTDFKIKWLFFYIRTCGEGGFAGTNLFTYNFLFLCCSCFFEFSYAQVVHLYRRKWIEESTYPRFTMIGQSFGSVYLSWEALCKFTPLYYFDTSGYAFTYPLARIFGCRVICYTHYPTISLDMISRVRERSTMYNNNASIAQRWECFYEIMISFMWVICNCFPTSGT